MVKLAANPDMRTLLRDVESPSPEIRGRAMQALLRITREHPTRASVTRPLFERAIESEFDAWTATSAVRGLEFLDGPAATTPVWRKLLMRKDAIFASRLALAIDQPVHVPMLLGLLARREELPVRSAIVATLGRLGDRSAVEPLLALDDIVDLQPDLIVALGNLADPRATAWLEQFRFDSREMRESDERGAVVHVSDAADEALRRIAQRLTAPIHLQPLPVATAATSRTGKREWLIFLPLLSVGVEVIWFVVMVFYVAIRHSDGHDSAPRSFDVIAALPVLGGLAMGSYVLMSGYAPLRWQKAVLLIGLAMCALICFPFAYEFFDSKH